MGKNVTDKKRDADKGIHSKEKDRLRKLQMRRQKVADRQTNRE